MSKGLRLSQSIKPLPVEMVGEANAVIGKRNSGKTVTAKVFAEELLTRKQQVIVAEPTDVWWGLRSPATGKGEGGFPIAVFGGSHADLPLEPGAGRFMAELLIGERISAVLCLKPFSKTQRRHFMADFAERLLEIVEDLVHVILEEAHEWIPQRATGASARMLGACSDLTTTGRTSGIGTTIVSQRPARIHKDAFEQTDNLIVHQLVGPNDRAAVERWVKAGELMSPEASEMLQALPKLKQGQAFVYAPATLGEPVRVDVRALTTFDSSATPKPGQSRREPRSVADIDLEAVRVAMSDAIERAKADDPREWAKERATLQKQVADLERQLADVLPSLDSYEQTVQALQAREPEPVLTDADRDDLQGTTQALRSIADEVVAVGDRIAKAVAGAKSPETEPMPPPWPQPRTQPVVAHNVGKSIEEAAGETTPARTSEGPTGSEQRILDALAWWEAVKVAEPSRLQVAAVAGYHPRTKNFTNSLGTMRSAGWIDYPRAGFVTLRETGRAIATYPATPPTTAALHEMIFKQVGKQKARILAVLIQWYPQAGSRAQLAESLGYHERTKNFTNGLGALRTLGWIDYPKAGEVVALPSLFIQ